MEHRGHPGTQSFVHGTGPEFAADPDSRRDLIPRSTSAAIIQQREILTEQTRRQDKPRAPRQLSFRLVKNDRTRSEVRDCHDAERDRRPKKQDTPWPEDRAYKQDDRSSCCVIRADAAIHDNWQRGRRLAKEVEAISSQDKPTYDVDDVVLVSEHRRETDEKEPKHRCEQENAAKISRIEIDQEQQQRGVQRREKIKGRIHSTKPIKDRAEPSGGMRARESKAQREKQKAKARNENRGYDPPRKDSQLLVRSTKERGGDEEEVDRHVGETHERNEWDGTLPLKIKRADLTALPSDPITTAVNDQKQDRQSCRNCERFKTRDVHAID